MSLMIIGCGYVGQRVAAAFAKADPSKEIYAVTRSDEKARELETLGLRPLVFHWLDCDAWREQLLPTSLEQLLISVPHREDQNHGIDTHVRGLQNVLNSQLSFQRLIYLSTTGVFGGLAPQKSLRVTEDTETAPTRVGPKLATAGEQFLAHQPNQNNLVVLRLAGIYGPDRIPMASKIKAGEVLPTSGAGTINLIHVADIAQAILHLFDAPTLSHMLYQLSDGHAVKRAEFYAQVARLCQAPAPRFDPNSSAKRPGADKVVDPSRILGELPIKLHFPSYREGLESILGTSTK